MTHDSDKRNNSLTYSLAALACVGVSVSGCANQDAAEPVDETASAGSVKAEVVPAPENEIIDLPEQWQRVEIALTEEQRRDLAQLGVETDTLRIATYNISQLGELVVN